METVIECWPVFAIVTTMALVALAFFWRFTAFPTRAQIGKIEEWLLYQVVRAEIGLGSGTGPVKLRLVYDRFVKQYPWIARSISFEDYAELVDKALERMHGLMYEYPNIMTMIEGEPPEMPTMSVTKSADQTTTVSASGFATIDGFTEEENEDD